MNIKIGCGLHEVQQTLEATKTSIAKCKSAGRSTTRPSFHLQAEHLEIPTVEKGGLQGPAQLTLMGPLTPVDGCHMRKGVRGAQAVKELANLDT